MKLILAVGVVALSIVAGVAACVGDDPAPAAVSDGGVVGDTGTDRPGSDGGGGGSEAGAACTSGTRCGETCVELATSAENCGACGHSCGGGTCSASACTPVLVASNLAQPLGVAVAGGSAFWLRNGAVERCAVTGCTGAPASITAEVVIDGSQPGGTVIVTDGNKVAWIASGNGSGNGRDVFQCGVAGCTSGSPPKASTGLTDAPTQIAVEGATIFSTQNTGAERQAPIATLAFVGAGTGSDVPTGIAADATNLYVSGVAQSAYGVDRCTRAATAGAPCTGATRLFVGSRYVAAGAGMVLATSTDGIKKCASTGCGGSADVVMAGDTAASAIAASSAYAAWTNPGSKTVADGTVRACALPACTAPRTIATGQAYPVSVTIDGGFVYWANRGIEGGTGSIWRAAL
ncbi:MAG: putative serine/threonine-protein kinase pknH [Labilithrix sp.]|nr:putative serine/threonine-protein kinase pknH [Labilithrix sp.]